MLKIISANVNGLKAYYEKGAFDELISKYTPDIVCLQETKCSESKVGYWISDYNYEYIPFSNSNHKKRGYAGVSTLIKESLLDDVLSVSYPVLPGFTEYSYGRVVVIEFSKFQLINVYWMNSGDKDLERMSFDQAMHEYISKLIQRKPVIVIGDMNTVSDGLDYWGNFDNARDTMPGLKIFEQVNLNKLKSECNLLDSFRELYPDTRAYSWYSYQGGARVKNHGWRLDLALVSSELMSNVADSFVHSEFIGSDHCPIELHLNI